MAALAETTDTPRERSFADEELLRCVQYALRSTLPERTKHERRRERRHPFPYPVRLRPVDLDGHRCGDAVVVLGKHITNHGLDFYFHSPIAHRRVVASFESQPDAPVEILMDLTWCRFGGHGWYENGGRFLSAMTVPVKIQVGNRPCRRVTIERP